MRSYNQFCAVAKSLDVVGERWTLLIVRELLLRGPSRYTDLRNGLPGIATNLLADRLQELERAGVVAREDAPPPIATTLFSLTSRGRGLASVVRELRSDVVGEGGALLTGGERLRRGPGRYTDLRTGLPGIATTLLADRLQELERAGVVAREDAPPPIATTLFSLTSRGRGLASVVREL